VSTGPIPLSICWFSIATLFLSIGQGNNAVFRVPYSYGEAGQRLERSDKKTHSTQSKEGVVDEGLKLVLALKGDGQAKIFC
jgi:hypothetical protein